jgi:hypothetical protein
MSNEDAPEEQEPDAQDVALQWMMHGQAGLNKLYTERPVPPQVSAEAWNLLHASNQTSDGLAMFLASVHLPIRECKAPSLADPRTIVLEA